MQGKLKKMWISSIRDGWPMYLLALLAMAAGIFFGHWGARGLNIDQATQLSGYLDLFVNQVGTVDIDHPLLVKSTITNNLIFIGIIYFLGLTVIGAPVVLALLFMRGFSLGFAVAFLAKEKGSNGVILAMTSILPQNILLIPAIYLAGVASLSFSCLLIKRFRNSRLPVLPGIMGYHLLIIVVSCIAVAAGLVEAFVTPELIKGSVNFILN